MSNRTPTCHPDRKYQARGLCTACYATAYYRADKDRHDARARELRFARYGWTVREYEIAKEAQGNRCFLCGREGGERHQALVPDHDHETGKARRLLCRFCNSAIGLLRDDPEILARAAEYVASHKPLAMAHGI